MKSSREGDTFRELKKVGYELRSPEDDYSEQPDSGGRIGGGRGANEFGIVGGVAELEANEDEVRGGYLGETAGTKVEDETIDYLREKLNLLPSIDDVTVFSDADTVIIEGHVDSLDIRDQVNKVAEQILREQKFINKVDVRT